MLPTPLPSPASVHHAGPHHPYRSWHKRARGAAVVRVALARVVRGPLARLLRLPACPDPRHDHAGGAWH